MIILRILPNT